jgi:hypothetical protein
MVELCSKELMRRPMKIPKPAEAPVIITIFPNNLRVIREIIFSVKGESTLN